MKIYNTEYLRKYVAGFEHGTSDLRRFGLDHCLEESNRMSRDADRVFLGAYRCAMFGGRPEFRMMDYLRALAADAAIQAARKEAAA